MQDNGIFMDNREVAALFKELADLMAISSENPFKIRTYENAYRTIRGFEGNVLLMPKEALERTPGFGKAVVGKIGEIAEKGTFDTLERYRRQVPAGLVEISRVSGLGPKKVKAIHEQLGIDTLEGVLAAAEDGTLAQIKGISAKSIAKYIPSIQFLMEARGKVLFHKAEEMAAVFEKWLQGIFPERPIQRVGTLLVFDNVVESIDLLMVGEEEQVCSALDAHSISYRKEGMGTLILEGSEIEHRIHLTSKDRFGWSVIQRSASPAFIEGLKEEMGQKPSFEEVRSVFDSCGLPEINPRLWHDVKSIDQARKGNLPSLIKEEQMNGLIHFHTLYSDGTASIETMVKAAIERGWEYVVVTDHSKSAGYASGLQVFRLEQQWREIEQLQMRYPQIDIYKGIESDILKDGALDYPEEVLAKFDVVIGSIHSGLDMEEEVATKRILHAIQNPYLRILGHLTGRLLLRRAGYPLDIKAIIDACAEHGLAIEINANPRRLDLDWHWVAYAMQRGVFLSIQPDAHSVKGVADVRYGVLAGQKGGLTEASNLSSLSRGAFAEWVGGE